MIQKIAIALLVFSFLIPTVTTQDAYAEGSGGEPLISDAVGWGIVAAVVIVCIYFVVQIKPESLNAKEQVIDRIENDKYPQTVVSDVVTSTGSMILVKW